MNRDYPTAATEARMWAPTTTSVAGSGSIGRDLEMEERVLVLDDITSVLAAANNRINDLVASAREHADGLFGAIPQKSDGGQAQPKQVGRLSGLRDGVQLTHELLSQLERELVRLRAL